MSQPDETTLQARVQELEKELVELRQHMRGKEALIGFAVEVARRQNQMIRELGAELEKYKAARNAAANQEQTNGR